MRFCFNASKLWNNLPVTFVIVTPFSILRCSKLIIIVFILGSIYMGSIYQLYLFALSLVYLTVLTSLWFLFFSFIDIDFVLSYLTFTAPLISPSFVAYKDDQIILWTQLVSKLWANVWQYITFRSIELFDMILYFFSYLIMSYFPTLLFFPSQYMDYANFYNNPLSFHHTIRMSLFIL